MSTPMSNLVRTDDVLAPHHLMELFACGDEYDGPDLDDVDSVQVCDGVWQREGELWRFWKYRDEQ